MNSKLITEFWYCNLHELRNPGELHERLIPEVVVIDGPRSNVMVMDQDNDVDKIGPQRKLVILNTTNHHNLRSPWMMPAVEHRSLADVLSLSCARLVA